jgi:hypothetical protein
MISQSLVDQTIDTAVFNGFSDPKPTTALDLAVDMVCYCELFENEDPEVLKFFVEDYLRRHPNVLNEI